MISLSQAPSNQRWDQRNLQLLAFNFWPSILSGPTSLCIPVPSRSSPQCLSEDVPGADVRASVERLPQGGGSLTLAWPGLDKVPVNLASHLQQQSELG